MQISYFCRYHTRGRKSPFRSFYNVLSVCAPRDDSNNRDPRIIIRNTVVTPSFIDRPTPRASRIEINYATCHHHRLPIATVKSVARRASWNSHKSARTEERILATVTSRCASSFSIQDQRKWQRAYFSGLKKEFPSFWLIFINRKT